MASNPPAITLRLYCHGLGDCHLVGLPADDGSTAWIMIDCGIHTSMTGGPAKVAAVVADVAQVTGNHLLAVVGTHEHWDHNSGFDPSKALFANFKIDDVWLAWTEDPKNGQAQQLDKFKGEAVNTLTMAAEKMPGSVEFKELASAVNNVLGFFGTDQVMGIKGEQSRAARDHLAGLAAPKPANYLEPGQVVDIPGVSAVRCYVLAPPHDEKLLGLLDSKALTYSASSEKPVLAALRNGLEVNNKLRTLDDDPLSPFDGEEGFEFSKVRSDDPFLKAHYENEPARRIDHDWLTSATDLALQLDNKTNNTSLVLAFENVATGHVLIFAADAQIGNWQSWAKVHFPAGPQRPAVTGAELMARAVFYKVGHHGSRNATLSVDGLELMTKLEVAFNPTDQCMAKKVRWSDIPAVKLNAELFRRTGGRLILSDAEWVKGDGPIPIHAGGALVSIDRASGPSIELVLR